MSNLGQYLTVGAVGTVITIAMSIFFSVLVMSLAYRLGLYDPRMYDENEYATWRHFMITVGEVLWATFILFGFFTGVGWFITEVLQYG